MSLMLFSQKLELKSDCFIWKKLKKLESEFVRNYLNLDLFCIRILPQSGPFV